MLCVKQGGTKYHFYSLWSDATEDWNTLCRSIGKQSTHLANASRKFDEFVRSEEDQIYIMNLAEAAMI